MKCQNIFPGTNKNTIINLLSAEYAYRKSADVGMRDVGFHVIIP